MKIRKIKLRDCVLIFVSAAIGVLLISMRESVSTKISESLTICADVLIPSLFPFMVLSSFACETGIFGKSNKLTLFVMNRLFRLPVCAVTAILFGFVGGYPVGARVIGNLYETGQINHNDVKHLFSFCVNAGPAFIVSAAGGVIIGSKTAGYIILASLLISSLLTGVIYARIKKGSSAESTSINEANTDYSGCLVNSVASAASGMLSICAWVTVFFAISGIAESIISNRTFLLIYKSLAEVTSGLPSSLVLGGVPFASAVISFGGFSVMCQILPVMKKCGIKVSEYLFFRIINSISVYFITYIIMKCADVSVPTVSQFQPQIHFAPASAALLIMCAVLIFDLAGNDTEKFSPLG